ncbi:MAG: hypothetical protein UT63_C0058G0017 [Candidatus Gottesmanbacteria bacterium GW2011_GWC2_39_8]|uniref:Uncharacterized protein n=1 Tax=Candidatus Gottesmanbacteria bacterium GW2011_GWC2_39_8 TaxID=1618450 RepID=A0A0G0Q3C6_9BACT|nr:MAG: hypothetical protein UT63_C0058G0017 [Candidatus Gottesmanbacteria bacterium GW2011_GWC2_39_8]
MGEGFVKFEFGRTWVETEIGGEDDLPRTALYVYDAYEFARKRGDEKKLLKLKRRPHKIKKD